MLAPLSRVGRRRAIAGAVLVGLLATAAGGVWLAQKSAGGGGRPVAVQQAPPGADPSAAAGPGSSPSLSPPASPSPSPAGSSTPAPAVTPSLAGAPAHFATLAPGSALRSDAQCAAWVRAQPVPENKRVNATYNQATGSHLAGDFFPSSDDARANAQIGARVDGAFTGTTHEILR